MVEPSAAVVVVEVDPPPDFDEDLGDLVRLTFYLVGEWDTDARRQLVASRLGAHHPCMTLLFVAGLASPRLHVEIDAWASRA